MRIFLTVIFYLTLITGLSAQTWEVGAFAGSSGYMGDINPVKPYKMTDLAFGGLVKKNFDNYWSLKLNFVHGKVQGDDAKSFNLQQQQRNLNFYSPVNELSLQTEFNFFKYSPGELPGFGARKFSPFLFTGIAGFMFNPKTIDDDGDEQELKNIVTENADASRKYKTLALSIPYGAGVKYNISGNWNLIGELGYRTAFTDYLDDVSLNYPNMSGQSQLRQDLSDRSTPKIGAPNTQRGDYRKQDTYMFAGFSLTYTFVSRKCPMF